MVDDGYKDDAVEKLGEPDPPGPLRGGKYSNFEGGTRVPFIVRWPARVKPGVVRRARVSQVDFLASFAALTGRSSLTAGDGPDSVRHAGALLGDVEHRARTNSSSRPAAWPCAVGQWKYIEASKRPRMNVETNTELGNDAVPATLRSPAIPASGRTSPTKYPDQVKEMQARLDVLRRQPGGR